MRTKIWQLFRFGTAQTFWMQTVLTLNALMLWCLTFSTTDSGWPVRLMKWNNLSVILYPFCMVACSISVHLECFSLLVSFWLLASQSAWSSFTWNLCRCFIKLILLHNTSLIPPLGTLALRTSQVSFVQVEIVFFSVEFIKKNEEPPEYRNIQWKEEEWYLHINKMCSKWGDEEILELPAIWVGSLITQSNSSRVRWSDSERQGMGWVCANA